MIPDKESEWLTTGQAANRCSVTPDTILKWIKKGRLKAVQTAGGHHRIEKRALESLFPKSSTFPKSSAFQETGSKSPEEAPEFLRCWQYMSNRGSTRDECKKCLAYRARAAWCFAMTDVVCDLGQVKRVQESSCEECSYYRRVNGMATNVLIITPDEKHISRLSEEKNESLRLRFARNGYEASGIIHEFRPAFVIVDQEYPRSRETELIKNLATDPRLTGIRIIIALPHGTARRKKGWFSKEGQKDKNLIDGMIEKPYGANRVVGVINSFPVEFSKPENLRSIGTDQEGGGNGRDTANRSKTQPR